MIKCFVAIRLKLCCLRFFLCFFFEEGGYTFFLHPLPSPTIHCLYLCRWALPINSRSCCSPAQMHVWLPRTRRTKLHILGGAFKVELSSASSHTIPLPCPLELLVPLSQTFYALKVSCTPCLGICPVLLPRSAPSPLLLPG